MNNVKAVDTFLVGVDFTRGEDDTVMVIGKKEVGNIVQPVNVIRGERAQELYKELLGDKN
jgi:hypothetical protein